MNRRRTEDPPSSVSPLPPLGRLFGIPLLFDEDLLQQDGIYFNAGSLTVSMAADPRAIDALEQAIHY
jgi:Ala-tRNA(Pro) deacylase